MRRECRSWLRVGNRAGLICVHAQRALRRGPDWTADSTQVRAAGIGNDMRAANAEALRMLAKVMGVSLKQVKISIGLLKVSDMSVRDIFRRLICAMY